MSEDTVPTDPEAAAPDRAAYTVLATEGLFKNGKLYAQGETIMLTVETGQAFIDVGDVELQ